MEGLQDWQKKGFASAPTQQIASGKELLYRAYGGASRPIGSFFFAPKDSRKILMLSKLTADDLEDELNVSLWGNTISKIGVFRLSARVTYFSGDVAQDLPDYGWVSFIGAGVATIRQILVPEPLDGKVTLLDMMPIASGNYHIPRGPYSSGWGARKGPRGFGN